MAKFRFWSSTEDNALRTCISKFKNDVKASRWAARKFDRTESSVYQRIQLLRSGKEITYNMLNRVKDAAKDAAKLAVQKEPTPQVALEKGVNIPKGFTFDIQPSRAVMFEDHVRLYF
jgi:hypothetical protein